MSFTIRNPNPNHPVAKLNRINVNNVWKVSRPIINWCSTSEFIPAKNHINVRIVIDDSSNCPMFNSIQDYTQVINGRFLFIELHKLALSHMYCHCLCPRDSVVCLEKFCHTENALQLLRRDLRSIFFWISERLKTALDSKCKNKRWELLFCVAPSAIHEWFILSPILLKWFHCCKEYFSGAAAHHLFLLIFLDIIISLVEWSFVAL